MSATTVNGPLSFMVPQAYDEYVKAWFACKVLAKEYGLGSMDGFQFNMSVVMTWTASNWKR